MVETTLDQYPEIVAVIILVIGLVAANVLAAVFEKMLNVTQSYARQRMSLEGELISPRTRVTARRIVYYVTVAVFMLWALKVLGIGMLSEWLDVILDYVPALVSGITIIFVGYLGGLVTYSLVASVTGPDQVQLLPRLAQVIVVVTAVLTGLSQMSIDVSFVTYVIGILMVTTLGALALAFGFGSRSYVGNILALRELDRYKIGDRIRIDEVEGTVIGHHRTGLTLQTTEGQVDIPAGIFSQSMVTRLSDV